MFKVKIGSTWFYCISTRSQGWEHVSVVARDKRGNELKRMPSWSEMCRIKELFWEDDEAVIQIHPPKSQHVNFSEYCLHLWRPIDGVLPLPPKYLVY